MKKKLMTLMMTVALAFSMIACGDSKKELTGEFAVDIPDGFTQSPMAGIENNYVAPNYPTEASSMNWTTETNDGSFDSVSSDTLISTIESQFKTQYGVEVDIELVDEDSFEIDGRRAFKYEVSYDLMGMQFSQIQCIVEDTEDLYFVTYTDVNDEGYSDEFKESLDSIRFE